MNLYYNTDKTTSKCNWVMDSLLKGWPDAQLATERKYLGEPAAFWGFIQNNWHIIKQHQKEEVDWYFWDMPYHGRWSGLAEALNPTKDFYWRMSRNGIHETKIVARPGDRFATWNLKIEPWRKKGESILVASSSDTMTRWATGMSVDDWEQHTVSYLKKYTKRPIVVRRKPRAEGTSGPDAAKLAKIKDFKYILDDVFAVVTTVSMCVVESLIKGVPSFCSPYSAANQVSRTDLSLIETPLYPDREPWFNHIAYCQFTHKEIELGVAYECLNKKK